MRRFLLGFLLLLAALPARPQASTIPNLALDASPAETDMIEIRKAGDARDKRTTRSTFFSNSRTCAANQMVAGPSGGSGLLTCRLLVAADIPALAYLTSLAMPSDFTVTGTAALAVTRNSQAANLVLASPSGSTGAPSFRALVYADFPTIATGKLLGSVSAGTAAPGAVTVSTGLNLSTSGVLTATAGAGVTSVAATVPSWLTVAGSPITTSGTLAFTAATGQTAGRVVGTCGAGTSVSLCALVAGDIPTISAATQISGTLAAAQFPALTGDVTTSAGSLATTLKTSPVIKSPTIGVAGTAGSSHIVSAGVAPTASCTGLGSGSSTAVVGTDLVMVATMTTGTGPSGSGTCTFTFSGTYSTNMPGCTPTLMNTGATAWGATSTVFISTESLTAPQFTWNTNAGGLTASTTYKMLVVCIGK